MYLVVGSGLLCSERNKSTLMRMLFLQFLFLSSQVETFSVDTTKPIVYKGQSSGSYFGYSVAIVENNNGTWILVGAPRANDSRLPSIHEPGTMFQCSWKYRSSCKPVTVDQHGNEKQTIPRNKPIILQNKKDFQWLGASLDVNHNGNKNVIVCAPRWKDAKHEVQGHLFMNGICYESDKNLKFNEDSPLPALDNVKMQIHMQGHYAYGMGSLGTSAQYSKDGTFLVLGAPGLNDWTGGFVHVLEGLQSRPKISEPSRDVYGDSYLGYAVTTARLTADEIFTIIGGPRSNNTGKVVAYNMMFEVVMMKEGEQFGSYFGAAVCAADLNGDGRDDLLVGAPTYMKHYDEGRVYVYINKEFFKLDPLEFMIMGSNTAGARFGTAIMNLHDINNDNFHDIAIGAPYEATSGVVYIYNGAKTGLQQKFSQRIVGSSLDNNLRTFGYSISRPWDVDRNSYADFVVGAHESDRAVLLRTRSVLDLRGMVKMLPSMVSLNATTCKYKGMPWTCIKTTVCLEYSGVSLPPTTEVKITLRLDTLERKRGEQARLFILDPLLMGAKKQEISETVELQLNKLSCVKEYTVYVQKTRDVITPLQMELLYDIPHNVPGMTVGCDICPIRNIYSPAKNITQAFFVTDCGNDGICDADLHLQAHAVFDKHSHIKNKLVIDRSPAFEVEVTLVNMGETAYLSYISMNYPDSIYFSRVYLLHGNSAVTCLSHKTVKEGNNTGGSLECDIVSPLAGMGKMKVVFRVRFFTVSWPFHRESFNVSVKAKTASMEKDELQHDNAINITVPVVILSRLQLYSVSLPGQLQIPSTRLHANESEVHLTHLYTVHNLGPSPFPYGQLIVTLPKTPYMWLRDVKTQPYGSSNISLDCRVLSELHQVGQKGELNANQSTHAAHKDEICHASQCIRVLCDIGVLHAGEFLAVALDITVQHQIMYKMKGDRQPSITSTAILEEPDLPSFVSLSIDKSIYTTTFLVYEMPPRSKFTWWVIGISVVSGILLLYIIIIILWKCGFFRRKRREELQKLIETTSQTEGEASHSTGPSTPLPSTPFLNEDLDENDIMVLSPTNSFFPESPHQTFTFHTNNNIINSNYNHHSLRRSISGSNGRCRDNIRHHRRTRSGGNLERSRCHFPEHHHHWTPPPLPPPPPLPAFNNQLYLEPMEHTV